MVRDTELDVKIYLQNNPQPKVLRRPREEQPQQRRQRREREELGGRPAEMDKESARHDKQEAALRKGHKFQRRSEQETRREIAKENPKEKV